MSYPLPQDTQHNQAFSIDELLSALKDAKNTTPGLDNICYEMFKHMSVNSLAMKLRLFNKIWFTEKIPSWLHSIIVPIPKAHKPTQMPSSYRPISLTSNVCKFFEKMVVRRLKWFLDYNNILSLTQSGFRQRRKTTDHLLRLHDIIHKSLANKRNVLAVFVDVEKSMTWSTKLFFA